MTTLGLENQDEKENCVIRERTQGRGLAESSEGGEVTVWVCTLPLRTEYGPFSEMEHVPVHALSHTKVVLA